MCRSILQTDSQKNRANLGSYSYRVRFLLIQVVYHI